MDFIKTNVNVPWVLVIVDDFDYNVWNILLSCPQLTLNYFDFHFFNFELDEAYSRNASFALN